MKTLFIGILIAVVSLAGCSDVRTNDSINKPEFFGYMQDLRTGVVFAVSMTSHNLPCYCPVPTDQIDAVKHLVINYKEPEFLTKWKKNNKEKE